MLYPVELRAPTLELCTEPARRSFARNPTTHRMRTNRTARKAKRFMMSFMAGPDGRLRALRSKRVEHPPLVVPEELLGLLPDCPGAGRHSQSL